MDIHGSIHGCGYPWILPSKHIHMDVVRAIHGYPTGYPSTAITATASIAICRSSRRRGHSYMACLIVSRVAPHSHPAKSTSFIRYRSLFSRECPIRHWASIDASSANNALYTVAIWEPRRAPSSFYVYDPVCSVSRGLAFLACF
jgi:hypothetical protein